MPRLETPSETVRFGAVELNLRARELRRNGILVKLSGQPFEILALLLERPGDVVMRKELQNRLWPADTFVDFEHGMNNAIKKLRTALGDDAEHPLYVETLARVGYRFVAPAERMASGEYPRGGEATSPPGATSAAEPAAGGAHGCLVRRDRLLDDLSSGSRGVLRIPGRVVTLRTVKVTTHASPTGVVPGSTSSS
jgi:DNA-binding winged helix-turn-helix (wHTH) protein